MKRYTSNVLIYIAALLGIVAFVALFASPLRGYDSVRYTWYSLPIRAYIGEQTLGEISYKGTFYPAIGFIVPFIVSIFLIIESFKPALGGRLAAINTILAILYFLSAIIVLLTKELFLIANEFGDTLEIANGVGPILSAICSGLAGVILLVVTWLPGQKPVDFIKEE